MMIAGVFCPSSSDRLEVHGVPGIALTVIGASLIGQANRRRSAGASA